MGADRPGDIWYCKASVCADAGSAGSRCILYLCGKIFSSSVSHVGRAPVSVFADMDEYAGIFLSASDGHLKVTMFDEKMKKGQIFATDVLATLCIVVFAAFMIVYGVLLMKQSRSNTMAGLNIPYAWMYLALPVTGVSYIFALISQWTRRKEA